MSALKELRVLFFLRRIGPYHHARFNEARKKLDLIAVETRPLSEEYPWEFDPGDEYGIERFPASDEKETGLRGQRLEAEVKRILEKHHPDVVVTTGWADPEYHAVVLAARATNIPCVVISDSRHEDEPRKFYKEAIKRVILRSYSAALAAGTASRGYLVRLGFDSSRIFQPWDVVDNQYFGIERNEGVVPYHERPIICVSRFIPKKNLPRLIEAFGLYRGNGGSRRLLLIGSGEQERMLRDQIDRHRLGDQVEITGFVQYEHLPTYFSRAHCLILPSTTDQWGLVVNEAMAAGLPVLVSQNCGCAADLVRDKENGCIFDPFRVDDIANNLLFMSGISESSWKEMGKASRTIIANWDLEDFSQGLRDACRHALNYAPRQAPKWIHRLLSR